MDSKRKPVMQPSALCLLSTLSLTGLASALLCFSIFTPYWELVRYNATRVDFIAYRHNDTQRVTWLFEGKVARIAVYKTGAPPLAPAVAADFQLQHPSKVPVHSEVHGNEMPRTKRRNGDSVFLSAQPSRLSQQNEKSAQGRLPYDGNENNFQDSGELEENYENYDEAESLSALVFRRRRAILPSPLQRGSVSSLKIINGATVNDGSQLQTKNNQAHLQRGVRDVNLMFLVPMYGGIWHLCLDIPDSELRILREMGFQRAKCTNYMDNLETEENVVISTAAGHRNEHAPSRMHNLSISCALVCLILLGSSSLLGIFGIVKRQINAVLITGVMFLLSAAFASFTLTIMYFKRTSKRDCGIPEDEVNPEYIHTRTFSVAWSMDFGWAGAALMLSASILWIFFAKIMRYNPVIFL